MGQGLYDLLGWGVLTPPHVPNDDTQDALCDAVTTLGLRTAYETTPDYLVIPLAVDEGFLQEHWHLPALPLWVPRVEARTARVIDMPWLRGAPPGIEHLGSQGRAEVAATWIAAQRLYAQAGLVLGAAQLILLSDWD